MASPSEPNACVSEGGSRIAPKAQREVEAASRERGLEGTHDG